MQLTRAMTRAMAIMIKRGRIYVEGGFGVNPAGPQVYDKVFAKRITINCLIREGLARSAEAYNAFELTEDGRSRFADWARRSVQGGKRNDDAKPVRDAGLGERPSQVE